MVDFESGAFQPCREWIAKILDSGKTWDDVLKLDSMCDSVDSALEYMADEELWPTDLNEDIWKKFVTHYKEQYISIQIADGEDVVGIDKGGLHNSFSAPTGYASSWEQYKQFLKEKMSSDSIANLQKSCLWILNHLYDDTREYGEIKGLVTGSVQSGKTANMEGLISMAADYDWNFFIVLSGTIDNLRKQTRDRFRGDLQNSEGGVLWRVLDFTAEDKKFSEEELRLNSLRGGKSFANRYLTVCLKNRKRLEKLIDWLYDDPRRTNKLRIVVIDDEADQASINTAEITPEEEQERCAINQMIVNLVNGRKSDGSIPAVKVQSMNYICYTATPYANVLNEGPGESLYPKDFICTLPESHEYFGAKVIFGNEEEDWPGLPIIRSIPQADEIELKALHKEEQFTLPGSLKRSIAWFLCVSAIQRKENYMKPVSMLVHTSAIQSAHFIVYERIQNWLKQKSVVLELCQKVYSEEKHALTVDDLRYANPDYGFLNEVKGDFPAFEEIQEEISELLNDIRNIELGTDKKLEYGKGIHLCVDNCRANKEAEEGTYLRIVYPDSTQIKEMEKAPIFLVVGGNTLSRGLTIEGLVCTYFSRNSNQADTLMQMARWFGYRKGYELLQRIWMTADVERKFEALTKIDMDLKREVERFMEKGISPSQFGPRIRNIPEIAKFRITSKKKSQSAEYDDFDFCGDSYETTDFDSNDSLTSNLELTNSFIQMLNGRTHCRPADVGKAYVWDLVDYAFVRDNYLGKYLISKHSSLYANFPYFGKWIEAMNSEGKLCKWNVAVVDGENKEEPWIIVDDISVGMIERTKKSEKNHVDIGSLRSGLDAVCDVCVSQLSPEQELLFKQVCKSKKDIISARSELNLEDVPLLLIYRIKKDGGTPRKNSKHREALNEKTDIIGISIIVSGDSIGESHAKTLRIKM